MEWNQRIENDPFDAQMFQANNGIMNTVEIIIESS